MSRFLTGSHPQRGTLWVAIDEQTHHLSGEVAERRFSAFLRPFKSTREAEAALVAAGAVLDGPRARKDHRK
jgi:hypothetical protein